MNKPRLPRKLKKYIKLYGPSRLADNLMLLMYYAQKASIKITSVDKLEWVEEQIVYRSSSLENISQS